MSTVPSSFINLIETKAMFEGVDPVEIFAIAYIESRFDRKASSHTGDYGMMQVNCRVWWKHFQFASQKQCRRLMLHPELNIHYAIQIIKLYRKKYKQCIDQQIYYCYNGGPGWQRSKNRDRIKHYGDRVKQMIKIFKKTRKNDV